jgi:ubiquinone/menaquinone biosynthesis C-methylase UbiE
MPEYSYEKAYYERLINRNSLQLWMRKYFFSPLEPYLKGDVLDLGCGIGEVADHVETKDRYFGVDINPFCIEYLNSKKLWAKLGSAYDIPMDSKSVDVVIFSHVLEHLSDPPKAMNEINRVLRPSGTLIVIVPMRRGYITDSTHRKFYDSARLREIAEEYDYEVISISNFPIHWELLGNYFYFFEDRLIAKKKIV